MDWSPVIHGFTGGVLIGLAALSLFILSGRIAGISGIVGGLYNFTSGDNTWRYLFVAGLLGGGLLTGVVTGRPLAYEQHLSWPLLAVAGILVGYGTRLGSGCTSGHGVCGLARLSPRSVTATALFIGMAMLTYFLTRHVLGILT